MTREKLTLGWRGHTATGGTALRDDFVELAPAPPADPSAAPVTRVLELPPLPRRTAQQQHYDNVLRLLDGWAEWVHTGEPLAEGAPRQCMIAPDARIQSVEDMEIEANKRLVREVHTAVWELSIMEREAVMLHYGLNTRSVWRAQFDQIFDQAVYSLFEILKARVSC